MIKMGNEFDAQFQALLPSQNLKEELPAWYHIGATVMSLALQRYYFFFYLFVTRRSRMLDSMYYQKSTSHAGEVTTVTWTSHDH
jgi:hypothetical protein